MIAFTHPAWLAAAAAWALALAVLARRQRPALDWIETRVAASRRHRLTRYSRRGVVWHFTFLFLLGAFLAAAAAGPYTVARGQKKVSTRTVLLLLDASLSMGAGDTQPHPGDGEAPASRFAQARLLASELIAAMPDAGFGLITFSGVTVVHAPPTRDHRALLGMLDVLTYHVDLTLSGTRFSTAFEAVIHMAQHQPGSYQVVLMSDGELPESDDYDTDIEVLAELGIPVHAIGFGTTQGEGRVIYHPDDIMQSLEKKRVVREYHTRRVDETLEAIADATGGSAWTVAEGDWTGTLLSALSRVEPTVVEAEGKVEKDLSAFPLAAFLLGFLVETLWISRRPRRRGPAGRPPAGRPPAVAALLLVALLLSGCRSRTLEAHLHNELGIGLFEVGQYPEAAPRFEKSMSYRVRRHVPLFNLAANSAARGEHAVAHDYYQEVLLLEPRLAEAHYNDGHALYGWGELELDLEECRFDRARQLWQQALERFRDAGELAGVGGDLAGRAEQNGRFLEERLTTLDREEEACVPPPPPEAPPPPQGAPPPPPSEPPPSEPPPEGEGGGGLSDDEKEEVRAALERIQQEASSAAGYRQSRHQQITDETVGKAAGMEIWW